MAGGVIEGIFNLNNQEMGGKSIGLFHKLQVGLGDKKPGKKTIQTW